MSENLSFLALGDSYTVGEGVEASDSWPYRLKTLVDACEKQVLVPHVVAQTGWTSADLFKAIALEDKSRVFDLVSLCIGVNNQYQGLSETDFQEEFTALLELAIGFAENGAKSVVVLTVPDWSVTQFAVGKDRKAIAHALDGFNSIIRLVSKKKDVTLVDISPISRLLAGNKSYFAKDGLHYSKIMHDIWAEQVFDQKLTSKKINPDLQQAVMLDQYDSLHKFKEEFVNDKATIYLDGNSLGKLPKKTIELSRDFVEEQWGKQLIRGWNQGWIDLSTSLSKKIACLVGAAPEEIFVGDSTSLNLFKLAFATLKYQQGRTEIVTDTLNFPSDLYVLRGLIEQHFPNHKLNLVKSDDGIAMNLNHIGQEINTNTALLTLSHVTYKSSFMYPMKEVSALAHKNGSLVLWDLSHSVGAVPINLENTGADMAVGCTYKYLNGGPGAPAFLYVRKELQDALINPIWSWFSHEHPFDFNPEYQASPGIEKFAISTPGILSMAAIEPGVDLLLAAEMEQVRKKSLAQSEYLMNLIEEHLIPLGFKIASPRNPAERGSHLTLKHPEGYRINRAMINPINGKKAIIPDFRPPNNIRLGIAPLYTSFTDLYHTVERIVEIVLTKDFERFEKAQLQVP